MSQIKFAQELLSNGSLLSLLLLLLACVILKDTMPPAGLGVSWFSGLQFPGYSVNIKNKH